MDSDNRGPSYLPRPFGKYELLEEIGRGGMGVVYKARQVGLDRLVAIRMILPSQITSADDVRRFYREARAAGGLCHPHIIDVYEVGEVHGQHFFAMAYIDGESLAEVLRRGLLPPDDAAQTIARIAAGVQCLHQRGLVHRDLKPSNLLISATGQPIVADFGLARDCRAELVETRVGAVVGTPSYMSPEQAAGRTQDVSPRSDVFSLGVILYEMLTGQPPFRGAIAWEVLMHVIESEPTALHKLNRRVPPELEQICLRALEKNPARRYASAAEMAADLERYLKREPIGARPASLWQRVRRWARKEPTLATHWTALGLLTLIVQTVYLAGEGELDYHLRIISIIGLWAAASFGFQLLLNRSPWAALARYAWSAADVALLTLLLGIVLPPVAPLLVGYPLLIAASGLFFRVRLVTFTTAIATIAFALLVGWREELQSPLHYAILFAMLQLVLGGVVAHQVYRVRVLSHYYDRRAP